MIVLDNILWYYSKELKDLVKERGVKFRYLLPYSPDLNFIEAFFYDFKAILKKRYKSRLDLKIYNLKLEFKDFLRETA